MSTEKELAMAFLRSIMSTAPKDHNSFFVEFEDYFDRELYYELTTTLLDYFNEPDSMPFREPVFTQFVQQIKTRILQRNYVQLSIHAKEAFPDFQSRLGFAISIVDEINETRFVEASLFANISVAQSQLQCETLPEARATLDKCQEQLDSLEDVENIVRAFFFKTNAQYYHKLLDYTNYYRKSFLYLACVELSSISAEEKVVRARELIVSALLSDKIYNFGELIQHPILESLTETAYDQDLQALLNAVNSGNVIEFTTVIARISSSSRLSTPASHIQLKRKVALTALMETVLEQPPNARAMGFEQIAQACGVAADDVEHLVMKALSLGLVKGSIDQVDQIARINWVHPRVMTKSQIKGMRDSLTQWAGHVGRMSTLVEEKGRPVWIE